MEKNSAPKLPRRRFIEAQMANIVRIGRANVEALVKKTLWRIGMSINDDC